MVLNRYFCMIDSILQRHWAVWEDETSYQFFSDTEGKLLSKVQFGDGSYQIEGGKIMPKIVQGIYRNGAIELLEKVDVKEGTKATITFVEECSLRSPTPSAYGKRSFDDEEMELFQRWLEQGLISSIPDQEIDEEEFVPISVKGKPVSEIIIEDRGPR